MWFFKRRRRTRRRQDPDYLIILCTIFLIGFGLIMLASASSNLGKLRFDNSYYYLKHQIVFGLSLGIIGFFLGSKIYYRYYEKFSLIFLILSIGLLALVFTPLGLQAGGADRWVQIGPLSFQPSEVLKLTLVVYLAAWLSRKQERVDSFSKGFLPLAVVLGTIVFLLLKQPSTTSAAIMIAVALIVYFVSGARFVYILGAVLLAVVVLASIIYFTPYRWKRITAFLQPETDTQASSYHINQTLIAIGSGGLLGVGYGQSTAKIHYLPEPIGDSIFAVIAEELGFVGAIGLLGVILVLVLRTFYIAARTDDKFGQLLLVGFGSLIAIQSFVNIAAVSGVIPLTGAPLPFISYGGTALVVFMTIAGIINNVSRYR